MLAVLSLAIVSPATLGQVAAAQGTPTLTKAAIDPQSGNSIPNGAAVGPGRAVKWVLSYNNPTSAPAHAAVTDPIHSGQTFVGGSLQTPPPWTKEYSTDGLNFGSTDLGAATAAVRSQADVPSTSTGAAVPVPPPITSTHQDSATNGDGFRPILFGGNVFNIFHHTPFGGSETIACTSAVTGEACAGYPKALGYGTPPEAVSTSFTPLQYVRPDGKMLFGVQRPGDYGVACFDLTTGTPCGYTTLSPPGTGTSPGGNFPAMIEGAVPVGSSLYFYGSEDRSGVYTPILYCFDPAALAPCASAAPVDLATAANGTVVAWNPRGNGASTGLVVQLTTDGTRIYLDQAFAGGTGSQVSCYDVASGAACSGWGTPLVVTRNAKRRRHRLRLLPGESRGCGPTRLLRRSTRRLPHRQQERAPHTGLRGTRQGAPGRPGVRARSAEPGHARAGHLRSPAQQLLLRLLQRAGGSAKRVHLVLGLDNQRTVPGLQSGPALGPVDAADSQPG